jgi:hypothetical protein
MWNRRLPLVLTGFAAVVATWLLAGCGQVVRLTPSITPPSTPTAGAIHAALPEAVDADHRYVIYVHGRIMEDEGVGAVSPRYGAYQFEGILGYLAASGLDVIGEVRSGPTDGDDYAGHLADQVKSLRAGGVPASHITLLGFSKGAGMVILASDRLREPDINYILAAICGPGTNSPTAPRLTGRILSLYEESDALGSSCQLLAERSPGVSSFDEIELSTGREHGAFYVADPTWLEPVIEWIWEADR